MLCGCVRQKHFQGALRASLARREDVEGELLDVFVHIRFAPQSRCGVAIAARFLRIPVEELRGVPEIETQPAFHTDVPNPGIVYPDITMRGHYRTGKRFLIIVENKWDSNANTEQLKAYRQLEQGSRLVFISPSAAQNALALPDCDSVFRWDQVFAALT